MTPWLIELPTCPSTNSWVLQHHAALAAGACVFTRQQTAGRGRAGTTWHAPEGVLTASFVLEVADDLPQIALVAGLAVCHAVEDHCPGLRMQVKWPNDVVLPVAAGLGKVGGILCERAAGAATVVVGIGLNVHAHWDGDRERLLLAIGGRARSDAVYGPTSIAEHVTAPPLIELLPSLRRYLLEAVGMLQAGHWQRLRQAWEARDALLGRRIAVADGPRHVEGVMRGVDGSGALLLEDRSGMLHALASGTVVRVEAAA